MNGLHYQNTDVLGTLIETSSLSSLLTVEMAIKLGVTIAGIWALQRFSTVPFRMIWSRSYDLDRNLERIQGWIKVLIWIFGIAWVLLEINQKSRLFAVVLALTMIVAAVVSQLNVIKDVMEGARLFVLREIHSGQRIGIGDLEGVITKRGTFYTGITTDSGESVLVPNHKLAGSIIRLHRYRDSYAVDINLEVDSETGEDHIRMAKDICTASPYRKPDSDVEIHPGELEDGRARIRFYTWSPKSVALAKLAFFHTFHGK